MGVYLGRVGDLKLPNVILRPANCILNPRIAFFVETIFVLEGFKVWEGSEKCHRQPPPTIEGQPGRENWSQWKIKIESFSTKNAPNRNNFAGNRAKTWHVLDNNGIQSLRKNILTKRDILSAPECWKFWRYLQWDQCLDWVTLTLTLDEKVGSWQ